MAMISISISAYNPHNHRFQGIAGTRQMDGYQGPIMSLGCKVKELDVIDSLISQLAEKAFIFTELIGKNKEFLAKFNGRFKFITKYMHKYYRAKSEKAKSKRFPIMNANKIFLSIIEINKHPELKGIVFNNSKLGLKKEDLSESFTVVDKLLLLYERTLKKVTQINRDFRALQNSKVDDFPEIEKLYVAKNIRSRFWDFTDNVDLISMNSMAEFVHERIQNKDLDYLIFRKLFKYYMRKEIDYSISIYEKISEEDRTKKYKDYLSKALLIVRSHLEKLTSSRPYTVNLLKAFDDEVIKSL